MRPSTTLLDNNVWRYLADYSSATELARWARRSGTTIQVAPSVLYEALRSKDPGLRRSLVAFMTHAAWDRLMPEAFEECREVLAKVRRLRPEWLLAKPDSAALHRTRYDWSRRAEGFWDRVRLATDTEARNLAALEADSLETARREAEARRGEVVAMGSEHSMLDLSSLTAAFASPLAGWNGRPVEPWRAAALSDVTRVLRTTSQRTHPYRDWLSPVIDLDAARRSGAPWNRFWLHDIEASRMPRFWLRWAFETLASARRVSSGTPCDIQLATYLITCDCFVSADRVLCQLIEDCRAHSPVRLPEVLHIAPGREGIEALQSFLAP